jgi:cobalt-zinc-cadmium efflux system membrane fusion protein
MQRNTLGSIRWVHAVTMAVLSLAACSKDKPAVGDDAAVKTPTSAAAPADEMKGMSGMKDETKSGDAGESGEAGPSGNKDGSISFTRDQIRNGKVEWAPAVMGAAPGAVTVPGQLVPNEDRTARLGAPAGGRVVTVRVQPGDRVARGQLLVTLQSPEAGMAQSDVAKANAAVTAARAQAQYARTARERAERLLALKAIPRQDYERAVADDATARAGLMQADAEAARARSTAGQLGAGGSATGVIALRSPLAGVVLERTAVPGAVVGSGAPLVVVTDPTTLWLQVNAPEKLAALLQRGVQLRFTVPAWPSQSFVARIDAVGAGLDPQTRTLAVRGVVPTAGKLKAAMLATVIVDRAGPAVAAVLVPDDAVQTLDDRPTVFIAVPGPQGGATFRPRPVQVGTRANGQTAVIGGLKAGDIVVTRGAFAIKAQLKKSEMPDMEM